MRNLVIAAVLAVAFVCGAVSTLHAGESKGAKHGKDLKPVPVKITKGPIVEWVADTRAVIAWSTNVRASTTLRYGTNPDALSKAAQSKYGGPTHRVKLTGLAPGTKYYYMLEDKNAAGSGTQVKSQVYEFETVTKGAKGRRYSLAQKK